MRRYVYLITASLLLFGAFALSVYNKKSNPLETYVKSLEKELHIVEKEVDAYLQDPDFLAVATKIDDPERIKYIENLGDKNFNISFYEGGKSDSIIFWLHNRYLPYQNEIEGDQYAPLTNHRDGTFEIIRKDYTDPNGKFYRIIGMIPIKYNYEIANEYFTNSFPLALTTPKEIDFYSKNDSITKVPLKTRAGKELGQLASKEKLLNNSIQNVVFFAYLFGFIFFGIFTSQEMKEFVFRFNPWVANLLLFAVIFLVRLFFIQTSFSDQFSHIGIFQKGILEPSTIVSTLGDLLINIVLLFWFSIFFFREFDIKPFRKLNIPQKVTSTVAIYLIIFSFIFVINNVFENIAFRTNIPLDFVNIFNLNYYSFIGLLALCFLILSFHLLSFKLMLISERAELTFKQSFISLGVATVVASIYLFVSGADFYSFYLVGFSFSYLLLTIFFINNGESNLSWFLVWMVAYAGFFSGLLYHYNQSKEIAKLESFAKFIASESDKIAEDRILELSKKVKDNSFYQTSLKNNLFVFSKENKTELNRYFLSDNYLLNKFSFDVNLTYSENDSFLLKESYKEYSKLENGLYLKNLAPGQNKYLSIIPVITEGEIKKYIQLYFNPIDLDYVRIYPELLVDEHLLDVLPKESYDFAFFKKDSLHFSQGSFYDEKIELPPIEHGEKFERWTYRGRTNVLYHPTAEKTLVISKQPSELVTPASLVSYIFLLLLIVVLILIGINASTNIIPEPLVINFPLHSSLRNRIHFSVIAVIILSFFVIGLVTIFFFQDSTEEYHVGRLSRKTKTVLAFVNNNIQQLPDTATPYPDVFSLSKINRLDINLFDKDGILQESSKKEIFEKGLQSLKINPLAMEKLKFGESSNFVVDERIGKLDYRTAYVPLINKREQIFGYLGLPYYSKQSKSRQDIREFMSTLINAYVMLLIMAGATAVVIANSITRPLSYIGEKLKEVKLGEKNEVLIWSNDDELGTLITQYNKMIKELELSSHLLAQSEREMAWREMAKQVAHEIKNPLTPMKLSIQYLQRAYQSNPDDVEPLLKRVTATLIEQIDNLSSIASAFSNFAKMPKATNEVFNINQLVTSVYDLFSEHQTIRIDLQLPPDQLFVFADKNQLMRVFNNLLKNAQQAIPEDREAHIIVRLFKRNDIVYTEFEDNGTGIPKDKVEAIFVPNFTTKSSGMGLGLAISKNIIENAKGSISFTTEENIGTTFIIKLPYYENDLPEEIGDTPSF